MTDRTRLAIAGVLVAMVATALGTAPASATPPGEDGLLALACEDGLWTIQPDGGGLVRVTSAEVRAPDWSPGGTRIAFVRGDGGGGTDLWVMNADGSGKRRLTFTGSSADPSWSPDALHIAFAASQQASGAPRPHIRSIRMDIDVSSQVLSWTDVPARDPAWAPDRSRIAIVAAPTSTAREIWVQRLWSVETVKTPAPEGHRDLAPDWAPTDDRYAFVRHGGTADRIHAVDPGGANLAPLTDAGLDAHSPSWSPAGTTIAYLARPTGTAEAFELRLMDPDGTNQRTIAENLACDHVDWQPIPDFPLVDARFSRFQASIRWAFEEGITTGCGPERFCPDDHLRRGPMASLLARALDLPPATQDHFSDDDGHTHEADINRLAEAGITLGCAEDRFCPRGFVTRAEVASFLARALDLPDTTVDHFEDDDGMTHEANINRLAEAGITTGCAPDRFCPLRSVTRGETVALLHRALP